MRKDVINDLRSNILNILQNLLIEKLYSPNRYNNCALKVCMIICMRDVGLQVGHL